MQSGLKNRQNRQSRLNRIQTSGTIRLLMFRKTTGYAYPVPEEIRQKKFSAEEEEKIRTTAIKAYRTMGCTGLSRVDFFMKPDGTVCINELNTLPGFTSISMYSKLFMESGISYSELVDRLIGFALERK